MKKLQEGLFFSLPTAEYLKFNNIYSGSFGEFNYKLFPDIEKNSVRVVVWKGKYSFEKSDLLFEENFIFEDNLILKINEWLKVKKEEI